MTDTKRPPVPLYRAIAGAVIAYHNCVGAKNTVYGSNST